MNFDTFKASLNINPLSIRVEKISKNKNINLDNEALFQLPFIAMVVLVMAKSRSKPSISELGRLVGECLEFSMPAFKKSNQHIAWSANLRVRTVQAVSFLEMAGLAEIDHQRGIINVSELGLKVITKALSEDSDLSNNLNNISMQYRNIKKDNKLELRLL